MKKVPLSKTKIETKLAIILIAFLILGAGVYFVLSKKLALFGVRNNNQSDGQYKQNLSAFPKVGWTEYTNEDFGYLISYPSDWQLGRGENGINTTFTPPDIKGDFLWSVNVSADKDFDFEKHIQDVKKSEALRSGNSTIKTMKVDIGGVEGDMIIINNEEIVKNDPGWEIREVYLKKQGLVFQILNGARSFGLFNDFYKSFRFVQKISGVYDAIPSEFGPRRGNLEPGETVEFRWYGGIESGGVRILLAPWYLRDSPHKLDFVRVVESAPNSGRYRWKIPNAMEPGEYFIRVECFEGCSDNGETLLGVGNSAFVISTK